MRSLVTCYECDVLDVQLPMKNVFVACAGGGMLGLTSIKPDSDGQWTLTQISCHSGSFLLFPESRLSDIIHHWEGNWSCGLVNYCYFECAFPALSSDLVTDMAFSPFDDSLLVTCSADQTVSSDFLPSFPPLRFPRTLLLLAGSRSASVIRSLPRLSTQMSEPAGICWAWVCVFRLSSSVYLRDRSKYTELPQTHVS